MHRLAPKAALGAATLTLAMLDWLADPISADAPPAGEAVEPATPAQMPPSADLGAGFAQAATFGDVSVTISPVAGRWILAAVSSAGEATRLDLDAELFEERGSPMSRMGSIPRVVASERIHLEVPAHGTVTRAVTCGGKLPLPAVRPAVTNAADPVVGNMMISFLSHELRLSRHGEPRASGVAVLRLADAAPLEQPGISRR